jgi:hypothetical protein
MGSGIMVNDMNGIVLNGRTRTTQIDYRSIPFIASMRMVKRQKFSIIVAGRGMN